MKYARRTHYVMFIVLRRVAMCFAWVASYLEVQVNRYSAYRARLGRRREKERIKSNIIK